MYDEIEEAKRAYRDGKEVMCAKFHIALNRLVEYYTFEGPMTTSPLTVLRQVREELKKLERELPSE